MEREAMTDKLTDHTIQTLLVAVGADRGVGSADFDTSFDDLDLDSLARTEFAVRIKEITGVDVEEHLAPASTPNAVRQLVIDRLSAGVEP
jgi:acyl carrier protein